MLEPHQVDIPAECRISLDSESVTTKCDVRLIYDRGRAFVLFKHSAGTIGYAGRASQTSARVVVDQVGTIEHTAPTVGSCSVNAQTIRITCSAKLGNSYVTIDARGWS